MTPNPSWREAKVGNSPVLDSDLMNIVEIKAAKIIGA